MPRKIIRGVRKYKKTDDSNIEGYNYSAQSQDEVIWPLMYQQALDGLKRLASDDSELTKLLDELATKKKTLCENADRDIADVLKNLAQRCRYRGKHKEAETFGKQALEILESAHGTDQLDVARQLEALALSCQRQEKYDEAESYYQRAIAIFETILAADDLSTARVKESLASCYFEQSKCHEAKELYEQALEIYKLKFGPDHLQVTMAEMRLNYCRKDDKSTNSQGHVAAETAKVDNSVGTSATSSAALAVVPTLVPGSSSHEVVSEESLSLMERVVADARVKIMAEIDGITEMNRNSHLNLKQIIEKLQAENFDQNGKLCRANRKVENLMCSQSTCKRLIAELQTEVDEKAQQLSSSEDRIENLECSRQPTLEKSTRLEAEISDQAQQLSQAEARIENLKSTSDRTIAELEAEIAEKSRQLAEAKRTIESRLFCSICVEKDANRMWSECRHVATCEKCALKLLHRDKGRSGNGIACPKCRTPGFPAKVFI